MVTKWFRSNIQTVTVISISVLFVLLTVLAVILTLPDNPSSSDSETQTVSFPSVSLPDDMFVDIKCEHTFDGYTDSYYEGSEELIYSFASYPVLSGDNIEFVDIINNSIYQFVLNKSSIKEHEKILAQEKYERAQTSAEGFIQFEFLLKTESIIVKEKFISILFSYTRTVSLSEPSYEYFSLTFDLLSGQIADLSDVIAMSEESTIEYVTTIISQDIAINSNIYYPNATNELEWCVDLNCFYFSDRGLILFFNPEILTPSVYGIRSFLIPYDKIGYSS